MDTRHAEVVVDTPFAEVILQTRHAEVVVDTPFAEVILRTRHAEVIVGTCRSGFTTYYPR